MCHLSKRRVPKFSAHFWCFSSFRLMWQSTIIITQKPTGSLGPLWDRIISDVLIKCLLSLSLMSHLIIENVLMMMTFWSYFHHPKNKSAIHLCVTGFHRVCGPLQNCYKRIRRPTGKLYWLIYCSLLTVTAAWIVWMDWQYSTAAHSYWWRHFIFSQKSAYTCISWQSWVTFLWSD